MNNLHKNSSIYIACAMVFVLSFVGAILLPASDMLQAIAAVPGVFALCAGLYQLMRDEWRYEREVDIQERQQDFILSTSSHVAEIAYDKHVIFCEEYIKRIQEGRQELFREGPISGTMNIGAELAGIRQRHSAWLTDEIENNLRPFERALIEIGANQHYIQATVREGMNQRKQEVIKKIYRSFGLILGDEKPLNDGESELHIDKVIDKIRDILGIKVVTKLRIKATDLALQRLANKG